MKAGLKWAVWAVAVALLLFAAWLVVPAARADVVTAGNISSSSTEAVSGTTGTFSGDVSGGVGSFTSIVSSSGTYSSIVRVQTTNGASWTVGNVSQLVTIAAAATTDTTIDLPANAIIDSVVGRVTTVIPTAATFTVGDPTTAARFATGVAVAATTTFVGLTHIDQTGAAGPRQTSTAKVRITPDLTPAANTGRLRITIFYRQLVAPTS